MAEINQVYKRENFKVYQTKDKNEYILQNIKMEDFAHTHVRNFSACKMLIELSLEKRLPYDLPPYFIISLIRVNSDEEYVRKLNELLISKQNKKQIYYNANKGLRA